jgi:hypothetical protein
MWISPRWCVRLGCVSGRRYVLRPRRGVVRDSRRWRMSSPSSDDFQMVREQFPDVGLVCQGRTIKIPSNKPSIDLPRSSTPPMSTTRATKAEWLSMNMDVSRLCEVCRCRHSSKDVRLQKQPFAKHTRLLYSSWAC